MTGRRDCCGFIGTSFESKRWLSLDACGFVCVSFSFGVHFYATITIGLFLLSDSMVAKITYGCVYLPITLLAVMSLFMAWTTNPGAVPMGARPLTTVRMIKSKSTGDGNDVSTKQEDSMDDKTNTKTKSTTQSRAIRRCHKCNDNYKPNRAHHDSVTGRCIVKFDHYCPWVGNAVGALNHKFFVLFIGYTICACITTLCLILLRLLHCGYVHDDDAADDESSIKLFSNQHHSASDDPTNTTQEATWHEPENKKVDPERFLQSYVYPDCEHLFGSPYIIVLLIVAVAFLIFTCCMMVEQVDAIESNQSKIARMKLKVGQGGTELERVSHDFNEMFGGSSPTPTWHWYLPLPVQFPSGMEKVVMGYEWDPTFDGEPFLENDMLAAIKGELVPQDNNKNENFDDEGDNDDEEQQLRKQADVENLSDSGSCDAVSLTDSLGSSGHAIGTKKRNRVKKTGKEDPQFVDRTKSRLM